MEPIPYPTNNFLESFKPGNQSIVGSFRSKKQATIGLNQVEENLTRFCKSVQFEHYYKESGVIKQMFNWLLWGTSRATTIYCLARVITAPSREYKMDEADFFAAMCAAITGITSLIFKPKFLSQKEIQRNEIYDTWLSFFRAYSAKNSVDMRRLSIILKDKNDNFPKQLRSFTNEDFRKIITLIRGIAYAYEAKNLAENLHVVRPPYSEIKDIEEKQQRIDNCLMKTKIYLKNNNVSETDDSYFSFNEYLQGRLAGPKEAGKKTSKAVKKAHKETLKTEKVEDKRTPPQIEKEEDKGTPQAEKDGKETPLTEKEEDKRTPPKTEKEAGKETPKTKKTDTCIMS